MYEFLTRARENLKRHFLLWLVFLFVIVLLGGYGLGYRPGPGLTLVRVGTLVVTGVPDGTNVYADQAPRGASKGGKLSAQLVPGSHVIIIDPPGDEPWQQIVTITSNRDTIVAPILVPKKPVAQGLPANLEKEALALVNATKLPTEAAPIRMGCADVFASANRVIVAPVATTTSNCTPPEYLCNEGSCEPTISYSPAASLRSIIPFPGRTDAVIVATGAWVYAIALDPRSQQFFAPVTQGTAPTLATASATSFFIADQGKAYLVSF